MDDIFLSINYVTSIYVQVRYLDKTLKRDMQFHKQIEQILIYQKSAKSKPNLKSKEYKLDKFCWYVTEKAPGKEITLGNKRVVIFQPGEYQIKEGECSETGLKEIWASGAILDGNSSGRFFRDYLTGRVDTDGLGVMYKVYDIGDDSFDYRYFTGPKKKNATRGKYYQGVPTSVLTAETEDQNSDIPIANFYDMAADFGNCRHEGGVEFKSGKKPEKLISMLMEHFSNKGDLVLDSFAGSATTAAVAHKMGRRWATIEMGDHCFSHTLPRLKNVVSGKDRTGISEQFNYEGVGGFSFCELDSPLFNSQGHINNIVTFNDLARHVYFTETGEPLPHDAKPDTPLLGIHNGTAVYLLYNGILKDKSPDGGNVLTRALLSLLPEHDGPKVIYGTACKIGPEQRRREGIVFKQLPYKLRTGVL
jgi:adenine-specific DNA-methyltransferase